MVSSQQQEKVQFATFLFDSAGVSVKHIVIYCRVSVVVGAPRDDVGPSRGGSVFLCPWKSTGHACQKLNFNQSGQLWLYRNNISLKYYCVLKSF